MGLFNKKRTPDEQEGYEQFMDGFREGYPLVGQPANPAHNTPEYQRGLHAAQQQFEAHGRPQIPYEEPTYYNNCAFCSGKCTGH